MTKMNGVNLPDMTNRDLIVDDIFSQNFNTKRKRVQIEYDTNKKSNTSDSELIKFGNNNNVIDKIESPQNPKRKSKIFDNYDIDKIVQSNMIIGKESDKTMRQCSNDINYKSNGHLNSDINDVLPMDDGNEYALKNGGNMESEGDDKMLNNNEGDYNMNRNDDHGIDVSIVRYP
ncbi:unnamed protein product [Arctia plantaginis]|uniref:Uncharacterized protein n=1 Tax=Arctia plantaginis TaxID=874455 RepID=A0A8S1AUP3_ARCPL|nr:unnamed protein product [Arctia plantaginis]